MKPGVLTPGDSFLCLNDDLNHVHDKKKIKSARAIRREQEAEQRRQWDAAVAEQESERLSARLTKQFNRDASRHNQSPLRVSEFDPEAFDRDQKKSDRLIEYYSREPGRRKKK